MVERGGLENRCALAGTVGSNPTLSAIFSMVLNFIIKFLFRFSFKYFEAFKFLILIMFWFEMRA